MNILFKLYIRFIRPYTERKLQKLFKDAKVLDSTIWNTYKYLPLKEFGDAVKNYEYKPDLLNGVVDFAYNNPNVFFSELGVSRDCFSEDTPLVVRLDKADIAVITFREMFLYFNRGVSLEVLDETGLNWITVQNVIKKVSDKDSYLFYGKNGTFTVTEDHPIFDGTEFKEASEIDTNLPSIEYLHVFQDKKPAKEVENTDLYWALGFFCADGYTKLVDSSRKFIVLTSTNEEYSNKALQLLNNAFGNCFEYTNYPSDEAGNVRGNAILRNKQYKIVFKARTLEKQDRENVLNYFLQYYDDDRNKIVPTFIFSLSNNAIKQFLDGYWCGNGYKYKGGMNTVHNSKKLAMQLSILYKLIGYKFTSIKQDGDKKTYILASYKEMPKNNTGLGTKRKKIKTGKYVYDITVDGGQFLVDGSIVHNCDDTSRVFYHYGLLNGYTAQEVIVTSKDAIAKKAHVVCVLEKDNQYWLCDYSVYGPFTSFERAVESIVRHWSSYTPENLLWERYYSIQ
jgi:hypothetical protein